MNTAELPYDEIRVFSIPLKTPFRGLSEREGVLLRCGNQWAEFSPFVEYPADEAAWWLACAHEQLEASYPPPVRSHIPVNCIVPAVSPQQAAQLVLHSGCSTAKVKVAQPGQNVAEDIDRVAAVRATLGAAGNIRIDANGAWTVDQAITMINRLHQYQLEYVEQPCATVAELAQVRARVEVPIAADESVRRATDPLAVAKAEAADILVLKAQPLGGVHRAVRIAEECGLPVVVSSAVESSVGLYAGLRLAVALPQLPYACGLGTQSFLAGDVVAEPLRPIAGELPLLDLLVDPDMLQAHAASPDRAKWWRARLATVYATMVATTTGSKRPQQ